MIGKLSGIVEGIEDNEIILNVNNIGYLITCPSKTLENLHINQELFLFIEMIIKENQMALYGFQDLNQKKWFKLLQTVQGVGAKMALNILNFLTPEVLSQVIFLKDHNIFKKIPGVGNKIAVRIINELQNKAQFVQLNSLHTAENSCNNNIKLNDAASALANLGFNHNQTYKLLLEVIEHDKNITLENLIKQVLAKLSKH